MEDINHPTETNLEEKVFFLFVCLFVSGAWIQKAAFCPSLLGSIASRSTMRKTLLVCRRGGSLPI
ncbi:mCG1042904 [Mus musculus]|nr:mCG1042904 [Mus musculus]